MQGQLLEVQNIYATTYAFAVVKRDGTVVTWRHGGAPWRCRADDAYLNASLWVGTVHSVHWSG